MAGTLSLTPSLILFEIASIDLICICIAYISIYSLKIYIALREKVFASNILVFTLLFVVSTYKRNGLQEGLVEFSVVE